MVAHDFNHSLGDRDGQISQLKDSLVYKKVLGSQSYTENCLRKQTHSRAGKKVQQLTALTASPEDVGIQFLPPRWQLTSVTPVQ